MRVVILDPALENSNAGDEIISNAISNLGLSVLSGAERITTHRALRLSERRLVSAADLVVLGGTNALSSHMERFRQWIVDPDLARRLRRKTVFMGLGWWQYQEPPCGYTRWLFRTISHPDYAHAARDDYTFARLSSLGLKVAMTGCPTTWRLPTTPAVLGSSGRAIVTVTDYYQDREGDIAWLNEVVRRYTDVSLVAMGPGDERYFAGLGVGDVRFAGYGVGALEESIRGAEHVGTRLHAGIHAASLGAPNLILAVDNRAREMRKSVGLSVVDRDDLAGLRACLDGAVPQDLNIPSAVIEEWIGQFDRPRGPGDLGL